MKKPTDSMIQAMLDQEQLDKLAGAIEALMVVAKALEGVKANGLFMAALQNALREGKPK